MGRLAGKNILITGGNSGIGLAAAQEFDREGARVAICGLNEGTLQAAKEALGTRSLAVRADVSNLTDLDTMFATIKRERFAASPHTSSSAKPGLPNATDSKSTRSSKCRD